MVVVAHLRSFYFITGFGHQAVIVFFMISGYLVGGVVLRKYKTGEIDKRCIKAYLIKRFTRIYLVLIPALLIGYILDYYGSINFSDLYTNVYHISVMNTNVNENLNLITLFGNTFNLQTIFVLTLGSNGPLWSLTNEWNYYILFIFLFINNWTRLLFLGVVLLLLFQNNTILLYSSIWIMGASLVLLKKQLIYKYFAIGIFFVTLILSRKYVGFYVDFSLAISLLLVMNSLQYDTSEKLYLKNFNHKMADFSYSLYLFHFPFFVFTIILFHHFEINIIMSQPNIFLIFCLMISFIYIYAYIMYKLFEQYTYKIQNYLVKYLKI